MRRAHEGLVEECARAAAKSGGSTGWDGVARAVLAVVWREAQKVTPLMVGNAWTEGCASGSTADVYLAMLRAGPLNPEGE